jgi:hypothetical protein
LPKCEKVPAISAPSPAAGAVGAARKKAWKRSKATEAWIQ